MSASILVVDDEDDLRDLLAGMLELRGYRVRTSRNGVEGLRALDERFPQLVISDVDMPFLDGPGMIYRMFIENLGRENIPVILISAAVGVAAIATAIGTPYFLAKPFGFNKLLAMVERALTEGTPPRPPTPFDPIERTQS